MVYIEEVVKELVNAMGWDKASLIYYGFVDKYQRRHMQEVDKDYFAYQKRKGEVFYRYTKRYYPRTREKYEECKLFNIHNMGGEEN
jgi:hypothetical protein